MVRLSHTYVALPANPWTCVPQPQIVGCCSPSPAGNSTFYTTPSPCHLRANQRGSLHPLPTLPAGNSAFPFTPSPCHLHAGGAIYLRFPSASHMLNKQPPPPQLNKPLCVGSDCESVLIVRWALLNRTSSLLTERVMWWLIPGTPNWLAVLPLPTVRSRQLRGTTSCYWTSRFASNCNFR